MAIIVGSAVALAPPAGANAASSDGFLDTDAVELLVLVDDLEAASLAKQGRDRLGLLYDVARYRYRLGRRDACRKLLAELEAEAAVEPDDETRVARLATVALWYSVVDPDHARATIERIEPIIGTLTDEARGAYLQLSDAYLQLGDYPQALRALDARNARSPSFDLLYYRVAASMLIVAGRHDGLDELRARVRAVVPRKDEADPLTGLDLGLEAQRIETLSACGLPDEALESYERCRATGDSRFNYPSSFATIAEAYVRAGKRAKAQAVLRRYLPNVPEEWRYMVARSAAQAGDFDLVRRLVGDRSSQSLAEMPSVIILAHRAGEVSVRDEFLEAYRRGLQERAAAERPAEEPSVETRLAAVEAAIGRRSAAEQLIAKCSDADGLFLRKLLLDLALRNRRSHFGIFRFDTLNDYFSLTD